MLRLVAALILLATPVHAAPLLGPQEVLVLVVDVTGTNVSSDATLMDAATATLDELAAVVDESSGGRVWFDFDVVGPVRLPAAVCDPGAPDTSDRQLAVLEAAVAQVDPFVDFSQVRQIAVLGEAGGCNLGNTGWWRRVWPFATADGPLDSSAAFASGFVGARPRSWTILHELGHTWGAVHNEPIVCTDQQRVVVDHSDFQTHLARCALSPPWYTRIDPMNGGWFHFSAAHKTLWGWHGPGELVDVTTTGTHTIVATESPPGVAGPRFLRIPLPASPIYESFLVEYRAAADPITPFLGSWSQTPGVYVSARRRGAPDLALADLLEPQPFVSQTEFTTRPLAAGIPLVDPQLGVHIMLVSNPDKSGATVFVVVPKCEKDCTYPNDDPPPDELAPPWPVKPEHADPGDWPKLMSMFR